jgi:hypothetical protein
MMSAKPSTTSAISAIDAEIEVLDEVIKLEYRKLDLLKTARHVLLSGNVEKTATSTSNPKPTSTSTSASTASSKASGAMKKKQSPQPEEASQSDSRVAMSTSTAIRKLMHPDEFFWQTMEIKVFYCILIL